MKFVVNKMPLYKSKCPWFLSGNCSLTGIHCCYFDDPNGVECDRLVTVEKAANPKTPGKDTPC